MIAITVQLFASYAEAFGTKSLQLSIPEESTVEALVRLVRELPGSAHLPPHPLVAVNLAYASSSTRLAAGDEVAIIPPVAGG